MAGFRPSTSDMQNLQHLLVSDQSRQMEVQKRAESAAPLLLSSAACFLLLNLAMKPGLPL